MSTSCSEHAVGPRTIFIIFGSFFWAGARTVSTAKALGFPSVCSPWHCFVLVLPGIGFDGVHALRRTHLVPAVHRYMNYQRSKQRLYCASKQIAVIMWSRCAVSGE